MPSHSSPTSGYGPASSSWQLRGSSTSRRTAGTASHASTTTHRTPVPGPSLIVNGEGGRINNLCVRSEATTSPASAGRSLVSLVSLTILGAGEPDLEPVDRQLRGWFGSGVTEWRHLRTYRIPRALPSYPVGGFGPQSVRVAAGLYACGDHREHPSLNGALASGRRAAEAVLAEGP